MGLVSIPFSPVPHPCCLGDAGAVWDCCLQMEFGQKKDGEKKSMKPHVVPGREQRMEKWHICWIYVSEVRVLLFWYLLAGCLWVFRADFGIKVL